MPLERLSTSAITLAPVAVNPDIDSKYASVKELKAPVKK